MRLQVLNTVGPPGYNLAPFFPKTSTRHMYSLPPSPSLSHRKWPNRFFLVLNVRCTISAPMTCSYTNCRSSSGSRVKKSLWPCACVRASISTSGSDVRLMVDARGRTVPCSGGEVLSENGFLDLGFGVDGEVDGMSEGVQRMPGRRLRSDFGGFIVGLMGWRWKEVGGNLGEGVMREMAWHDNAPLARARQYQPRRKVGQSGDGDRLGKGKRAGSWPPSLFRASFVWGSGGGAVSVGL